jgi:hypothetical protein
MCHLHRKLRRLHDHVHGYTKLKKLEISLPSHFAETHGNIRRSLDTLSPTQCIYVCYSVTIGLLCVSCRCFEVHM